MNSKLRSAEPLGAVAVQTDHVLPGHVGREGELALAAVNLEGKCLKSKHKSIIFYLG